MVIGKFTEYFSPKKNIIFECYKFNCRKQQVGESVDSFVTALYSLAETCEYDTLKEELIRDRIDISVRDACTSKRLQLTTDLTLGKALNMARQGEAQAKEGKILREEALEQSELNRVFRSQRNKNIEKKSNKEQYDTMRHNMGHKDNKNCRRCGGSRLVDFKKYPTLKSTCHNCQKIGH